MQYINKHASIKPLHCIVYSAFVYIKTIMSLALLVDHTGIQCGMHHLFNTVIFYLPSPIINLPRIGIPNKAWVGITFVKRIIFRHPTFIGFQCCSFRDKWILNTNCRVQHITSALIMVLVMLIFYTISLWHHFVERFITGFITTWHSTIAWMLNVDISWLPRQPGKCWSLNKAKK